MRTGLEKKLVHVGDLLLKSAFCMAAFVATVALCGGRAVATTGYVANFTDGTVSVINTATNSAVATIPVPNGAVAVAVTPDGTRAYVVGNGVVSVIDTATNTVVGSPIPVGSFRFGLLVGIAITPNGSSVYVANGGSGTVSVIDTASNTVVDTISVGTTPSGIAITPDGTHAYVVDSNVGAANGVTSKVFVIDIATNAVVGTIPVGSVPVGIAITPDGTHAYVGNSESGSISVIDIATNTVVDTISEEFGPVAVAITPDGTHVYVVNVFLDTAQSVSVIDTASNTFVGSPIPVGDTLGSSLMGLAVTPDGTGVYVVNSGGLGNTLSVISTASNTVTGSVTVGNTPVAVAFPPAILFSAFSAKLQISSTGFGLNGSFTLGAGGTINPASQPLALRVGTYTVTLPAGSLKPGPKGTFTFQGTVGGVALQIRLAPIGAGAYSIQVQGSGVNLTGLTKPVTVTLTIGGNTGTISVTQTN
jgi:YVTN family beta-propeller protein